MMTAQGVRCGNKRVHGEDRVYHADSAAVRACYAAQVSPTLDLVGKATSSFREAFDKPEPRQPLQARWDSIPVGGKGYGYYALDVAGETKFFRVERPTKGKWAGKTFIKEQAGDTFYPIEPRQRGYTYLTQIATDPQAAGMLYATELGKCTRCGRTLTDPESRARGIGPDCFAKAGW